MTPQELKNSILQLAIQGKLVDQRPEEGTAEDLYREIQAQKAALIKAGKIKKEKPLPEITEDEKPFDIPESWKWVHLNQIAESSLGKTLDKGKNTGDYCPYLCSINVYWNGVSLEKVKEARFTEDDKKKYRLKRGDLLICEGGDVGRTAIWDSDQEMYYQNALHRVKFFGASFSQYFKMVIECYKGLGILDAYSKGMTIKHLVQNSLYALWLPLPPLAEQKRIVAKIEELLPLIDRYEQAWTRLETFNKRFPGDMQKSLLQLAIQGKLVDQRPEEGTGEDLYRQIQAEKQSLIRSGKLKKEKPLPEVTEDEKPFDIPESWVWVRLASVTDMLSGFAFKSEDYRQNGLFRLLRGINLGVDCIRWNDTVYIDTVSDRMLEYKLSNGDVLLGLDRPWISDGTRVAIFDEPEETYLVQRVLRIRGLGYMSSLFIALLLHSSLLKNPLGGETTGISVPHISPNQVGNILIPLPPLAEQKRIVAKLEELLPLCDKLK